jgi:uridine kinase
MEIAEHIVHKLEEIKGNRSSVVVGVCGRAGSGKTTLSNRISGQLAEKGVKTAAYSGDWRFILDSKKRKMWLQEKWKAGLDAYMYAVNQFTWWNFEQIHNDLEKLSSGEPLTISGGYNRSTGCMDLDINIPAIPQGVLLYENAILGGVEVLEKIDLIILVNTPDNICFTRLLQKDAQRRSLAEIATRYLITTYSENIFIRLVLDHFSSKTLTCDSEGCFGSYPDIYDVSHIPVPISGQELKSQCKGTIFCDLDGTLIKHVPIPSETGEEIEILEGSQEKLKEFKEKGYYLILTTSRMYAKVFRIIEKLKNDKLNFDQIICDLPVGPRFLINDNKGNECRACAFALERDQGIKGINLP